MKKACHGCSDPEKTNISKITTDLITEVRKEIGVTCNPVDQRCLANNNNRGNRVD